MGTDQAATAQCQPTCWNTRNNIPLMLLAALQMHGAVDNAERGSHHVSRCVKRQNLGHYLMWCSRSWVKRARPICMCLSVVEACAAII